MKISLLHSGSTQQEGSIIIELSEFFTGIAANLTLPLDRIDEIIIADQQHFGAAIEKLSPGNGFTDDGIYSAVGKTVFANNVDRVCGSIVLMEGFVVLALRKHFKPANGMSPEEEHAAYSVYHEFGHCLDAFKRNTRLFDKKTFGSTVFEEYSACRLTASYMSHEAFKHLQYSNCGTFNQYLDILLTTRRDYRGSEDLPRLSNTVHLVFQRILIELAKEFAFRHGNPGWRQTDFVLWDSDPLIKRFASEWGADLEHAWSNYPACGDRFTSLGNEYFYSLSALEGYRFERREDGVFLWFD